MVGSTASLLEDEAKLARPTESIPDGDYSLDFSWNDVQTAVAAEFRSPQGQEQQREFGREDTESGLILLDGAASVEQGYFIKMTSGPYSGRHYRVTGGVRRYEEHLECPVEFHKDFTSDDALGGVSP